MTELPEVGKYISESLGSFKVKLMPMLVVSGLGALMIAAAALAPMIAVGVFSFWRPVSPAAWIAAGLVGLSAAFWLTSWVQAALVEAVLRQYPRADACYKESWSKIAAFSWACVLYIVFVLGGLCLFILPGIFLAVALAFAPFICVAEGVGGFDACLRSLEYARGRWFALFGRLALAWLAAAAVSAVPVVGFILGAFAMPLPLVGAGVVYASLRSLHAANPQPASRRGAAILAVAALGLLIPAWVAVKMAPDVAALGPALLGILRRAGQ